MLKNIPPMFPPRRRRKYPKRPAPALLTVISVTPSDVNYADWEFSGPVTLIEGATNVPELEVDSSGLAYLSPHGVVQVSPTILRGDYRGPAELQVGDAWRILTPPATIVEELEIPQSGTVT